MTPQRKVAIRDYGDVYRDVRVIDAIGPWALTPHQDDTGLYNVTHVPSGMGMFSGFGCGLTMGQARKALAACAALPGDWSRKVDSAKDLTPTQRKAGKAVRAQFMTSARR